MSIARASSATIAKPVCLTRVKDSAQSEPDHGCPDLVVDSSIDRLEEILGDRRRVPRSDWIEIYRRSAWTHRVSLREGEIRRQAGREDGVAVRVLHRAPGPLHFGASSGGDGDAVERAIGLAAPVAPMVPPPNRVPVLRSDRDVEEQLPPMDDLERWIEAAQIRSCAWVAVAVTLETWVSSAGDRATRRRTRSWSMIDGRPPIFLASRGWGGSSLEDWKRQIDERDRAETIPKPARPDRIVFLPEPSAKIALLLVAALHGHPETHGADVGPGWVVTDGPREPGALFGGDFDDVLDSTHNAPLARLCAVVGSITGTGHARRASFRDPPAPSPAHLVCDPPKLDALAGDLLVTGVRIHAVNDEWVLEIEPGPGWIRTSPLELAIRCLGGIGEARSTHRGGTCPSLVFDGLRVRW